MASVSINPSYWSVFFVPVSRSKVGMAFDPVPHSEEGVASLYLWDPVKELSNM